MDEGVFEGGLGLPGEGEGFDGGGEKGEVFAEGGEAAGGQAASGGLVAAQALRAPVAVRPWVRALREERALPSGERGPVDLRALARLARSLAADSGVLVEGLSPP